MIVPILGASVAANAAVTAANVATSGSLVATRTSTSIMRRGGGAVPAEAVIDQTLPLPEEEAAREISPLPQPTGHDIWLAALVFGTVAILAIGIIAKVIFL